MYFKDVFFDWEIEVEAALQCTHKQTHPQLKSSIKTRFDCVIIDSIQRRETFNYLQDQTEQFGSNVLSQILTENWKELFQKDWSQFIESSIAVTFCMRGFSQKSEKELNSSSHYW